MGENDSSAAALRGTRALLRIARNGDHIDPKTGKLSPARVTLADLRGEPIGKDPSRRRSSSTFTLCSQTREDIMNTARALAKEDDFRREPKGAAATLQALLAIDHSGAPALEIFEEPEASDRPGHVGIRFSESVRNAAELVQRNVRAQLVDALRCSEADRRLVPGTLRLKARSRERCPADQRRWPDATPVTAPSRAPSQSSRAFV